MGKKRIAVVGDTKEKTKKKEKLSEKKKVRVSGLKGGQKISLISDNPASETPSVESQTTGKSKTVKKTKPKKTAGRKYLTSKTKIDPNKSYNIDEAVKLVKEISYARFDAALEAHLITNKASFQQEITLPYFKTKAKKVEVANEETLNKIEEGKIDFNILIASPSFMPKLVKYAKILGPKGLMPNPKNGTITDNIETALKKFEKPFLVVKTEQKAPLIHTVFGRVSQKEEELKENLQTIIQTLGPGNIKRLFIKSTMSPAVKVSL